MHRLRAPVVVEPHGPLELVPRVQQQHVGLRPADLRHLGEPPRHPGEAGPGVRPAPPGVQAGLLHAGVVVVGVEQRQLEAGGVRRERAEEEDAQVSKSRCAPTRRVHFTVSQQKTRAKTNLMVMMMCQVCGTTASGADTYTHTHTWGCAFGARQLALVSFL